MISPDATDIPWLNVEMIAVGRLALTDSVLVFWTTLSLYAFWVGLHGEGRWRHAMWLFYIGMAFGKLRRCDHMDWSRASATVSSPSGNGSVVRRAIPTSPSSV